MTKRKRTELIVIHVTATPLTMKLTSAKLRRMHKQRGFSDIGYNEWIDQSGKLQNGRGVEAIGAHVRGYNSISYGISLEGGLNEFDATAAQMATLERRIREIQKIYPNAKVCGHRDLSPDSDGDGIVEPHEHIKLCPQFDVIPWAERKGLLAANIRGIWSKHTVEGPDKRDMWLQKLLRNEGYPVGPVDGIVGKKTIAALKAFQEDYRLEQSGKFDVETVTKLRQLAEKREPKPETKVVEVKKPIVPKNAEKTTMTRLTGVVAAVTPAAGLLGNFDQLGKIVLIVIGLAAVVTLLWRGELIARRIKSVLKSFEE